MATPNHAVELVAIAAQVMPGADLTRVRVARGQDHDVVLVPELAAIRISRHDASATAMRRRMALLRRLGQAGLPFVVPEPLTEVLHVDGRVAVATTWLPGTPRSDHDADSATLASLLDALREVDLNGLDDVLEQPHAYAGRDRWYELMITEAIPRLPGRLRDEARRRTDAAADLEPAVPCLVHGDLAGQNVHWDGQGHVVGVLDWDLAAPFDQAVDVACLASFGWDNVAAAVDPRTFGRARTWWRTFGIEQIVAAVLNDDPEAHVDQYVEATVRWLDQTTE